jgi:tetratricopeptide (TPR) repeat protein
MRNTLTGILLFFAIIFSCQEDKTPVTAQDIYELQQQISEGAIDTSYAYIRRADSLIQLTAAPDSLRAENNFLKGLYFNSISELDSAARYFYNAMAFVKDSIHKEREGQYFQNAWRAYFNLEQYGDALTVLDRFKSLLDHDKQRRPISWAYYNEQATYVRMKEYKKALEVNEERIRFARKRDTVGLPSALISGANLRYRRLKDREGAFRVLDSMITKRENLSYDSKRQLYGTYGVLSYYDGNYQAAYDNYKKAIENSKKTDSSAYKMNNLVNGYNNLAEVSIDLKRFSDARKYLDTVKSYGFDKIERRQQRYLLNYELRLASETNKSISTIAKVIDSIGAYQDRVYQDKFTKDLLALELANEKEKVLQAENQASEIRNLKLESRIILLSSVAVLLFAIGLLYYRQRKLKFETEGLQMQQRLLRSQMNPHFTFNTLSAIQSRMKTDKEGSAQYLLKFSRLLRLILENSTKNYVQLEMELDSIRKYMDLQLLRFPGKFTYKISLENMEEDDLLFIPPMLIQPFVENSIEHGFKRIDYSGNIDIKLELRDKFIHCCIADNGIGLNEKTNYNKTSTSVVLISDYIQKATKSQLKFTNRQEMPGSDTGVRVEFLIPYKLTEYD